MLATQIVSNVYAISFGFVNAFLIDADGLTLIDTGIAGSRDKILRAVAELGRQPADIRRILVTHCHGDHTGSLAAVKAATGAPVYMHPADAALVREGESMRPAQPSPGLPGLIFRLAGPRSTAIEATAVDYEVQDGDELPGGLKAIHTPGHCAGHLAFFWPQHGGVLFVGDTLGRMFRLGLAIIYEDFAQGQRDLVKLAALDFDVACFSHGRAIVGGAAGQWRDFVKRKGL